MRTPFIAGNWKMHKSVADAEMFISGLLPQVSTADGVEVAICVPYTDLQAMVDSTRGSRVQVFAQNMHQLPEGAYTGEVSAPMLVELDVQGVVLGHSERREYFGETDAALAEKVPAALEAGLTPILCVGETAEEHAAGRTEERLVSQLEGALAGLDAEHLARIVVAYEPIWAIGTGEVATPDHAQGACALIRTELARLDGAAAEQVRIQYGGSVKPDNAAELLSMPDIDGALVGGASLDPTSFAEIVAAAAP